MGKTHYRRTKYCKRENGEHSVWSLWNLYIWNKMIIMMVLKSSWLNVPNVNCGFMHHVSVTFMMMIICAWTAWNNWNNPFNEIENLCHGVLQVANVMSLMASLEPAQSCSSHYFNCTWFQAVIQQRQGSSKMSCVSVNSFTTRCLLKVVKQLPWVTKIVITLKQKGFSKCLCYFWSLYDFVSVGSIFKVLMFVGSLEFCRQIDRTITVTLCSAYAGEGYYMH